MITTNDLVPHGDLGLFHVEIMRESDLERLGFPSPINAGSILNVGYSVVRIVRGSGYLGTYWIVQTTCIQTISVAGLIFSQVGETNLIARVRIPQ